METTLAAGSHPSDMQQDAFVEAGGGLTAVAARGRDAAREAGPA
jgi:hypothetical protein